MVDQTEAKIREEEIRANQSSARMKQEAEKESQDLQVSTTASVHQMEEQALAHAKELTSKANEKAKAELSHAKQLAEQAHVDSSNSQKAQQDSAAEFDKEEKKETEHLIRKKQKLDALQKSAEAKMSQALEMKADYEHKDKEARKIKADADVSSAKELHDANGKAQSTLERAQTKLAKVASQEEGEKLKIDDEESKANAKAAELIQEARDQAVQQAHEKQQQAYTEAQRIMNKADRRVEKEKQKLMVMRSTASLDIQKQQGKLLKEKSDAEDQIAHEKRTARTAMQKEKDKAAEMDLEAKAHAQAIINKANKQAHRIHTQAEKKADEIESTKLKEENR
jgi:hypothetical protein